MKCYSKSDLESQRHMCVTTKDYYACKNSVLADLLHSWYECAMACYPLSGKIKMIDSIEYEVIADTTSLKHHASLD